MSRRGSVMTTNLKAKSVASSKRSSLKESTPLGFTRLSSISEPMPVKEGDIYYKTTRWYPSVKDEEDEEVYVSVVRPDIVSTTGANRTHPRSAGKDSSERADSRRGSVMSDKARDENIATPAPGDETLKPDREHTERGVGRAASIAGADARRQKLNIWPEFTDNDINAEKWGASGVAKDAAHKGKKEDKGKSPVVQHFFEDPEGKIELPPSLKVDHWKRPQDFIFDKPPTVVDQEVGLNQFDLLTANEHIHNNELMRYIVSEINALWRMHEVKVPPTAPDGLTSDVTVGMEEIMHTWKPWEHIYAINKVGKGPYIPAYNPHGKYAVRIFWLGVWRKVIVDDTMPFSEDDKLLLPATSLQYEMWPMLLTKALVKVASLDYNGGNSSCEFGDFSVIHCLTGWLPETIPLQAKYMQEEGIMWSCKKLIPSQYLASVRKSHSMFGISSKTMKLAAATVDPNHCYAGYGHVQDIWNLLKQVIPEFKLPEPAPPETPVDGTETPADQLPPDTAADGIKADKDASVKDAKQMESSRLDSNLKDAGKSNSVMAKGGKGGKESKDDKSKDKGKDKDKEKHKDKVLTPEQETVASSPEIIVFASYQGTPKLPLRVSLLAEMADASERLRQAGLSHLFPHPVWMTQTRSCPLEPPPPPEVIPSWKLIRPKKKRQTPSDEPRVEPEPPKPIQCVEITSPYVNYKVSSVPIPTDIHRPKSSLERGGAHSRPVTAANIDVVEETDENAPSPEPIKEEPKPVPPPAPPKEEESPKVEDLKTKPGTPSKDLKKKVSSASSKKEKEDASAPSPKPSKGGKTDGKLKESKESEKERRRSVNVKERDDSSKSKDSKLDVKDKDKAVSNKDSTMDQMTTDDENAEGVEGEHIEEEEEVPAPKPANIWMDWDIFCKCFNTLYIYHKPATYSCNAKHSDLKNWEKYQSTISSSKGDKKSAASGAVSVMYSDQAPHYLFVDNLKPTEIVVSFSSLSRWFDPPPVPPNPKEKESHTSLKGKMEKEDTSAAASATDGSPSREAPPQPVQPGLLVAEPYSWKSLVTGQPILRLRTTATRAAVLSLPEGRHVLRFTMTAPHGYHVNLCSSVQFVFGDEELVMSNLTKESCRFVDNATQVIRKIGDCIKNFSDIKEFRKSFEELVKCHCPYINDKMMSKKYHFKLFNDSLYYTLRKALAGELATQEMAFAWRAFNFDVITPNILGIQTGSRPGTSTGATSHRGSAKNTKKRDQDKSLDKWLDRDPTPEEHVAAIKIQRDWKGFYCRRIVEARRPTTELHGKVLENLQKAWAVLEPNAEQNGLLLFREIFKHDPELMTKYPFHKDEWNKISYADFSGNFPDQPPNTWFVVFREVFYVTEEMLAVPKLYVPINTCLLRIVNNDTGEEIPRVFQKVAPYVYKKNKKGYTFVAEARTTDMSMPSGRWRMRLIGSLSPLPQPSKPEVTCTFHQREIRDYYVPNEKNVILRYTVKVTEDHLASIQINTSKSDVYVRLSVLDREEEVASTTGKSHAVIPSFIFQKDYNPDEERRSSSRASNTKEKDKVKGNTSQTNVLGKKTRGGSAKSEGSRPSSRQSGSSDIEDEEEKDTRPHKYVIQATVLRNSWPLSQAAWVFVQELKELEKNELKIANRERPPSPATVQKQQASAAASKKKDKSKGKDKKDDKKDSSRPPSQSFDLTKPHWTLRYVSDAIAAEEVEVRKDTERADEIRAMKRAWEEAEPGRAAKALQSRQKYLNTHMIKVQPDKEEEQAVPPVESTHPEHHDGAVTPLSGIENIEVETILTLEPPPPPPPKEILQPLDITPFLRKTTDTPRYRDENVIREQMEAKQKEIQEYRAFREQVEQWREQDRINRNLLKVQQIEQCEEMQARLDQKRKEINEPREAFRQKYLEAERLKLEEIAAAEAALKAEQEKSAPSPKGRKSAKGKKSPAGKKKK